MTRTLGLLARCDYPGVCLQVAGCRLVAVRSVAVGEARLAVGSF